MAEVTLEMILAAVNKMSLEVTALQTEVNSLKSIVLNQPVPTPPPTPVVSNGVDWNKIFTQKFVDKPVNLVVFDAFDMCMQAYGYGASSVGNVSSPATLERVQEAVRTCKTDTGLLGLDVKKYAAAINLYRDVMLGISTRKIASVAVDYDLTVDELKRLHIADLLQEMQKANMEPDAGYYLLLCSQVSDIQPKATGFAVTNTSHFAGWKDATLQSIYEAEHLNIIGGGTPSGNLRQG